MLLYLLTLLPAFTVARPSDQFIIGGGDAADGAWPWQLSLRGLGGSHSCGASLIGATKAVTAAHCVGGSAASYTILAGTNQRSCDACDGVETRRITSVTRHPDYVDNGNVGYPNDVATLGWVSPLLPTIGKIQYVSLGTGADYTGRNCFFTGWGRTAPTGALPENLKEAKVDVLTTAECITYWSANQVTDDQVCVFDKTDQAATTCNGDTGGPLVCQTNLGRWELVGITSWNRTPCSAAFPTVCARISSYAQWINDN